MQLPSTLWTALLQVREDPEKVKDLVYRRYRQPVFEFARAQGLSDEDSEDATQEVFLQVCREEFLVKADRKKGKFRTLLLAVSRFVIASFRRRQRAGVRDRCREVPLGGFDLPEEVPDDPEFDRLWARNLVEQALERLKDDSTIPAYRLRLEGKSYREIAGALGRKETDVTNHVHRAQERLKRAIRKLIEEYSLREQVGEEIAALRRFL